MRTLAIECATEACSVALFEGDALISGDWRQLGRGHAEQLVPMIAALPDHGKAQRILVSLGPGSFTGLRVGLAAARALALAWQADLIGYPTLSLVAAQAQAQHPGQPLAVAMTGGHGEWFTQRYAADGLPIAMLTSLRPEAAASLITDALVAGSRAEALVLARGHGTALPILPDAREVLRLNPALLGPAEAIYGRAPDAKLPQTAPAPATAP